MGHGKNNRPQTSRRHLRPWPRPRPGMARGIPPPTGVTTILALARQTIIVAKKTEPMKVIKAPLLWLWIGPLPILWLVIGRLHGNGRSGFWMDMIAAATCSLFFGGLLAYKIFPTFKKRLFGSFIFSTGTLYLLSCLLFTGCFLPIPSTPPNPAKEEKMRQRYEARIKEWTVQHVVPRDASADSTMIDLTQYYDLLLPGQNGEDTSSQRFPRPGTHISNGIKFDVRGEIRLQWQRKVSGIPVNRKCSEIDFLH